jgi:hypothetical protein
LLKQGFNRTIGAKMNTIYPYQENASIQLNKRYPLSNSPLCFLWMVNSNFFDRGAHSGIQVADEVLIKLD